jgi:hypothetical protein
MVAEQRVGTGFLIAFMDADSATSPNLLMTATFGLFHFIYAACTWPRKTGGAA